MIFVLTVISVLFLIFGIYILMTHRKKHLERIILGENEKAFKQEKRLHFIEGFPRYLIFSITFFIGGWFLIGGVLWGMIFGIVGLFMPIITRSGEKKKQIRQMEEQLEDVLYQGVNVLRGGGGLYHFMEYLATKTEKPLNEVFETGFISIQELGTPPIEALKKVAIDSDLEDIGMMASALEEAQENGADLAEVVEMFATDLRNRRMLQKEIESKTTQGLFTANLLLAIGIGVPALLQVYGMISENPTIASGSSLLIDIMTAVCYMMMIVGYLIIRRMIQA